MDTQVVLYTLSTCPVCRSVRRLLEAGGIDHRVVEIDLLSGDDRRAEMEKLRGLSPTVAFPFLVAGDTVVVGNHPEQIRELFGLPAPSKTGVLARLFSRNRRK